MNLTVPLRVIIVEDEIAARQDLEDFFQQQPDFIIIGVCGTVHEAIVQIHAKKPDLLLLDIGLPDGTGFDILEQIPANSKVIFLTAHNEYGARAVRYGAIDYLLKPLNKNELLEALQRAVSAHPPLPEQINIILDSFRNPQMQGRIALRSHEFVQIVEFNDITYIQADGNYTTVFLNTGKNAVLSKTLKYYEELLPKTSFLRTHQSYLVNKLYIDRYRPKEGIIYLKDTTEILVSSRKKETVDNYFKKL